MNTQVKCVVLSLHLPHPPGVLDKQKSWLMHWFDSIHYFIPFLVFFLPVWAAFSVGSVFEALLYSRRCKQGQEALCVVTFKETNLENSGSR